VWNYFTHCEISTLLLNEESILNVIEKKALKEHLDARRGGVTVNWR